MYNKMLLFVCCVCLLCIISHTAYGEEMNASLEITAYTITDMQANAEVVAEELGLVGPLKQGRSGLNGISYENEKGDRLGIQTRYIDYRTQAITAYQDLLDHIFWIYTGNPMDSEIPVGRYPWSMDKNPVEDAAASVDLPFMKAEDAVEKCKAFFSSIDIQADPVLFYMKSYSKEALIAEQQRLIETDIGYADMVVKGKYKKADDMEERSLYCLIFGFKKDDIWIYGPCEQRYPQFSNADDMVNPFTAVVYMSQDGIDFLHISGALAFEETGRVQIVSGEEAEEKIKRYIDQVGTHYDMKQMYLSYAPFVIRGEIYSQDLQPVWNFTAERINEEGKPVTHTFRVHAETGEIIQ